MSQDEQVSSHYESGGLLGALFAHLRAEGVDPERLTIEQLAPYDQFHGRGFEATRELADALVIARGDHILDVGSGVGGPARYMADRFGCRVTGIDLTPEFCEVARHLTGLLGLQDRVSIEQGNALEMPFADATFDGAYSMNVSMNITDKTGFYAEVHRVLEPGARFVLSEITREPTGVVDYPTPWARTAATSHLSTADETEVGLTSAGFEVRRLRNTIDEVLAFGARSRELVARGEPPLQRAVTWIHGDLAPAATANSAQGVKSGALVPIEVHCVKAG